MTKTNSKTDRHVNHKTQNYNNYCNRGIYSNNKFFAVKYVKYKCLFFISQSTKTSGKTTMFSRRLFSSTFCIAAFDFKSKTPDFKVPR